MPGVASASDERSGVRGKLHARQFLLGFNTSTIRGQKLTIVEEIELARKAGYQAMEPWIDELERYAASGGSLDDLGKAVSGRGHQRRERDRVLRLGCRRSRTPAQGI